MRYLSRTFAVSIILASAWISFSLFLTVPASAEEALEAIPKISASLQCNKFIFDGTKSHDHEKSLTYFWDLGDGTTSKEPVVEHSYKRSGDYTVTLSVNDNADLQCSIAKTTETVRVNFPPTIELKMPAKICTGTETTLDASGSYDDTQKGLAYYWDFGDGTSEKDRSKLKKKYAQPGTYAVMLAVDDKQATCNQSTVTQELIVNAPPVAEAGSEEMAKCIGSEDDLSVIFDGSATIDANDTNLSYTWDFDDGETAEGVSVTHKFDQTGSYDVRLLVTDPHELSCSKDIDFIRVRLHKAPRASAGEDIETCTGHEVSFDGSDSEIPQKGTASYWWDLGEGTTIRSLKAKHIYTNPGTYTATLHLKNELNEKCPVSQDTRIIKVNSSPRAVLKAQSLGCVGETIFFDASESVHETGQPLEFYWNFGDGTIVRGPATMSHTYKKGGTYQASVVVDDGLKTDCSSAETKAEIQINTAPQVNPGPNLTCCVEQTADFDASLTSDPDGDKLSFAWDFGDGTKVEGAKTQHAYKNRGKYTITLTVNDQRNTSCSSASVQFDAEVSSSPTPIITVR